MIEIWKDIQGYEGLYAVSNLGRVKSLGRNLRNGRWNNYPVKEKILKPKVSKIGYLEIGLTMEKKVKTYLVHRLVAQAFLPNPDKLPCVNHKDECKTNNFVDNLEWCSNKYNINYGTRTSKTQKQVLCVELNMVFDGVRSADRYFNIQIVGCLKGKHKTAGGYHWKYVD